MPATRFAWLFLGCCAVCALLIVFGDSSLENMGEVAASYRVQRQANLKKELEVAALQRTLVELESDDRKLERLARERLFFSKPGEVVFIFEDK